LLAVAKMWDSEEAAGVTAAGNGTSRWSRSPANNVESTLFFLASVALLFFLAAVALLAYLTVRVILMPQPGDTVVVVAVELFVAQNIIMCLFVQSKRISSIHTLLTLC